MLTSRRYTGFPPTRASWHQPWGHDPNSWQCLLSSVRSKRLVGGSDPRLPAPGKDKEVGGLAGRQAHSQVRVHTHTPAQKERRAEVQDAP